MGAVAGIDLLEMFARAIGDAITVHESKKCKFKEGAYERLLESPEFQRLISSKEFYAFSKRLESEEVECSLKSVA